MQTEDELKPAGGWAGLDVPRLTAPPASERGLLFRGLSKAAKRFGRSKVPDIFSVMHINARLFWGWLFFASRLMPGGKLPARTRETIILRTAWLCRSRYEWGQHVEIALSARMPDADIVAISRGPTAFGDRPEQAVLYACDEMHADQCITDATWQWLGQQYDEELLIEIMMLIGHYIMVAGFLNSTGIKLEPAIDKKLQAFHQRIASQPESP